MVNEAVPLSAPLVCWVATNCSVNGAVEPNVAVKDQFPSVPTVVGVVPGSAAPPASSTVTVEPGVPVPVKVTVSEGTVELSAGAVTAKGYVAAGRWRTSVALPLGFSPVTWLAVRCSVTGAVAGNVAVVDQFPSVPTVAGVVPGSAAPPAPSTATVEPGVPVPVKVTVREATVVLSAGEVTARGCVVTGRSMVTGTLPVTEPVVTKVATRCSVTGADGAKVRVVDHAPAGSTVAGLVPGTRVPPESRMLTVEPGVPVPAKVTVREATVALSAGEVRAKG
jgi:hypothetical protein